MSNLYFNHTNRFVPGTTARAEDVNNVLDGVSSGFDLVEGDKSKKSGDSYTGEHDFTMAETRVAAPSSGNHPVTKLYADTLAFQAGNIPAQAENAGKFISTDGTNIFWSNISGGTF